MSEHAEAMAAAAAPAPSAAPTVVPSAPSPVPSLHSPAPSVSLATSAPSSASSAPPSAPSVPSAPAAASAASPLHDANAASAVAGGRETSNKILYVGMLHKSVPEDAVREVFLLETPIHSIKLLNDKNKPGFNYAFVEYDTPAAALAALARLNATVLGSTPIKVNWAFQLSNIHAEADEPLFNVFVGDLSPEVDDEALSKAFAAFGSLRLARVMWDMQTSRSRGYGFVKFEREHDALEALQKMNGAWVCGRAIRCNWASHRQPGAGVPPKRQSRKSAGPGAAAPSSGGTSGGSTSGPSGGARLVRTPPAPAAPFVPRAPYKEEYAPVAALAGLSLQPAPAPAGPPPAMAPQSYDVVLRQTPLWQTTVYLGNIAHFTQQVDLIPLLQNFGYIVDFKFHPEKGCAFVKYDSHERAALAIAQLAGFAVNGRPLKCGWGKDRPPVQYGFRAQPLYR
jgi:nucleolysin TIA-1/TIAR